MEDRVGFKQMGEKSFILFDDTIMQSLFEHNTVVGDYINIMKATFDFNFYLN